MNQEKYLLKVDKLVKYFDGLYGSKIKVLNDVSFSIKNGNGVVNSILAPFGSGKSTLLKIISGIIDDYEGEIFCEDKNINNLNSYDVVLIPEEPSSFPWLNVKDNILFTEKILKKKLDDTEIKKLVGLVGLTGYENQFPHNSSHGFRFRISLARALACHPKLILIDDSFKNMKIDIRNEMNILVKNISKELNMNFLLATTNLKEASTISERIFLMEGKPGKIVKEIDISERKINMSKSFNETYQSVKNEIEDYFKSKNKMDVINFSI